jgi:hypothetical protein
MSTMRMRCVPWKLAIVVVTVAQAVVTSAGAAETTMVLASVQGAVEVASGGAPQWQPAVEGLALRPEDQVRTGPDGRARIAYPDVELRLAGDSTAVLGYTSVRLRVGTTWVRMRKSGRKFEIITPTIAVSIRGTLVRTQARRDGSTVHLLDGVVDVRAGEESRALAPRTQAEVDAAGGLRVGPIDAATLLRLTAEYRMLSVRESSGGAGAGRRGASGRSSAPGGPSSGGGSSSAAPAGDGPGRGLLAEGLQSLERNLDARSSGLGVTGGSETAFDGSGAIGQAASGAAAAAQANVAARGVISIPGGLSHGSRAAGAALSAGAQAGVPVPLPVAAPPPPPPGGGGGGQFGGGNSGPGRGGGDDD